MLYDSRGQTVKSVLYDCVAERFARNIGDTKMITIDSGDKELLSISASGTVVEGIVSVYGVRTLRRGNSLW